MRGFALALLAAAAGCNQVFGLHRTQLQDAQLDAPDAAPGTGSLTWWNAVYEPYEEIRFPSIDGLAVQVGPMDGPLADVVVDDQGRFEINLPAGDPYRIVYRVPGDSVPHEVQWSVPSEFRLTVPLYGPIQRVAPSGSYQVSVPTSGFNPLPTVKLFTTGIWMSGSASYSSTSSTVTASASLLSSESGAPGTPSSASHDALAFVFFNDPNNPEHSTGYILVTEPSAPGAGLTTGSVSSGFDKDADANDQSIELQPLPPDTPIAKALGSALAGTTQPGEDIFAGVLPGFGLPSMSLPGRGGAFDTSPFIPLDHFTSVPSNPDCKSFASPFIVGVAPFPPPDQFRPPALLYQLYRSRVAPFSAALLESGYQAMSVQTSQAGCAPGDLAPTFAFTVGLAGNAQFVVPLVADNTSVVLPQNAYADLTFTLDDATHTNDCVVTLYGVNMLTLDPLRTFLVPAQSGSMRVHVPTSDFTSGAQYAFRIACRDGYPGAATGDYTTFGGYPQQESQIFPGTFTVTLQ